MVDSSTSDAQNRHDTFTGVADQMSAKPQHVSNVRTVLSDRLLVFSFSATLFCSALLMFFIQPLFGKMLLPRLGGTPQVWNTCMVFFQALLFAGYLHAHYTGQLFGLRGQAAIHIMLAFAALLALPMGLSNIATSPDTSNPILWLMQTLLLSVGAPMFVISSTAPLLQKWFSHSGHPAAQDPYFLYAASNLGSLTALISYPTLIEPLIDLNEQAWLVSVGFSLLVIALAACAWLFHRNFSQARTTAQDVVLPNKEETVTGRQRVRWFLLSFAPSSLLLGVTTYITTDIAAVPLFWIVPLGLYLMTFVMVFARKPLIPHERVVRIQPLCITLVVVITLAPIFSGVWSMLIVHLLAFFATALLCHGELVRARPGAAHLTEFYLWLSLGGVLGGAFNALLAPAIFTRPFEYALALVLACMLRCASDPGSRRQKWYDVLLPIALLLTIMLVLRSIIALSEDSEWRQVTIQFGIVVPAGLALVGFSERPVRFGLTVAATLVGLTVLPGTIFGEQVREAGPASRSFFGIYRVLYDKKQDLNLLAHGSTTHGAQSRSPALANQPRSYYYAGGPFGDLFQALAGKLPGGKMAFIGLGTGALTCYGTKDSEWTYYEIDPLVEKIARDPRYFTYLRDCPPKVSVIIGDARLMLRVAPAHHYNLIVVDAFSSDAIPIHLLTKEAIAGYLAKLAPDGVLALHISNRYMNLEPVIANLAKDAALAGRINRELRGDKTSIALGSPALLALLARNEQDLGSIANDARWRPLEFRPEDRVWSDNYVNMWPVLRPAGQQGN